MATFGVDLSRHDGDVSIPKLKEAGVGFVIAKCGGGDSGLYTDSKWEQNYASCKYAETPVGAYFFSAATTPEQAAKEAKYCLTLLKDKQLEYPVYMDVETKAQQELSESALRKVIQAWLDTIGGSWMRGVYTWAWLMPSGIDCETWFCAWTKTKPEGCGMWQFGGETNVLRSTTVAGYRNMDQSYAYRDYPAIVKAAGLNGFNKEADMTTYVSNCASDEYGGAYGGKAGDQTGREYRVREWYHFGQTAVYRHPNPNARTLFAQLATEAGENDHIGYDQSQRLTFRNALRKVGYHPKDITTDCESDCSASTGALIEAVGYLLGDSLLYAFDTTLSTHYMDGPLQAAGFEKLTASKYLTSGDYLLAGDICLKPASHVNIVVTNGSKSGASGGTTPKTDYEVIPMRKTATFKKRMNIRDAPSTKTGKVVSHYEKGSSVVLDGVVLSDGYVWGTYIGGTSGKRRYVSLGSTEAASIS